MSELCFRAKRAPSQWLAGLVLLLALRVSTVESALPARAVARFGDHRFIHTARLASLAFSPDGTALFATALNEACLWEVATGKKQRRFAGDSFLCGALSPDGRTVALAHNGSLIEVFDAASGELRAQLTGARNRSWAVTLSPDGREAASGDGREVILWNVPKAEELRRWQPPGENVAAVQFSPDGRRLAIATAGTNGCVRIEHLDSGGAPVQLAGGTGFQPWLVFSPRREICRRILRCPI